MRSVDQRLVSLIFHNRFQCATCVYLIVVRYVFKRRTNRQQESWAQALPACLRTTLSRVYLSFTLNLLKLPVTTTSRRYLGPVFFTTTTSFSLNCKFTKTVLSIILGFIGLDS